MLDSATHASSLDYYARIGAALFPIPHGKKEPFGIVESFKHDWSQSPEQWSRWHQEHKCNFGLVAGPSRLIIVDVDVAEVGRETAWRSWAEWCQSRGLPIYAPTSQSARGGWHILFSLPIDFDISTLRQCPLIGKVEGVSQKTIVDLRVGAGFVVAAGSYYDGTAKGEQSGSYLLFPDAPPPHPAPADLLTHCQRATRLTGAVVKGAGTHDFNDTKTLYQWMADNNFVTCDDEWREVGMVAKIEFGDAGLELWEILATKSGGLSGESLNRWKSFSAEPRLGCVRLETLMKRAHALDWKGTIRPATSAMFSEVAKLAAASGATLSSGGPMPMMAGQAFFADLAQPILADFLAATVDVVPSDGPTLPVSLEGHGLYASVQVALGRIATLTASGTSLRPSRLTDVLAVLNILHADVFEAVTRRIRTAGHNLQDRKIKLAAANLAERVERITVTHDKWEYDPKTGAIEPDNPDNLLTLLGILGLELRWNAWTERMEVQGTIDADFRYPQWSYVDDVFVAKLITRAKRTKTRFKLGKDFCWESLMTFAHANIVDPVLERLATLQSAWDGTPRLAQWLAATCGTPADPYHQAVARNVIGGMVRRIRQPGCKNDLMCVFFGPQGTGKSTIAKIIADMGQSTLAQIDKRSTPYFSDEVQLGDESKELVLSLSGKCLVEIGEMGQRNSTKIDQVKAMLSRQVDRGRTAYSRSVTERPRRNVFFGTVNGDQPLSDESGNRRFLPVSVPNELDLVWLSDNISQIIGEAAAMEAAGHDFALPREVWADAAVHQEAARSQTDIEVMMTDWFAETPYTAQAFITTPDLVELGSLAGWRNVHRARAAIMRKLGFHEIKPYVNGVRTNGWLRGPEILPKHVAQVTRYIVSKTQDGRPRVTIRTGGAPGEEVAEM